MAIQIVSMEDENESEIFFCIWCVMCIWCCVVFGDAGDVGMCEEGGGAGVYVEFGL